MSATRAGSVWISPMLGLVEEVRKAGPRGGMGVLLGGVAGGCSDELPRAASGQLGPGGLRIVATAWPTRGGTAGPAGSKHKLCGQGLVGGSPRVIYVVGSETGNPPAKRVRGETRFGRRDPPAGPAPAAAPMQLEQ